MASPFPPGRRLTSYGAHGAVVQRLAVHDAGVALYLPGQVQVGARPRVGEGRVLGMKKHDQHGCQPQCQWEHTVSRNSRPFVRRFRTREKKNKGGDGPFEMSVSADISW